jgi:SAM-dependent methyltransferase
MLTDEIKDFRWYHEIEIEPGVVTTPEHPFPISWDIIREGMSRMDFKGKSVLDIGARDGLWAFEAEKAGATSVQAIDNDLSPAGLWLKERWRSQVVFNELNLYDLPPDWEFDVVMFFGVLYHLRYPFWGLQRAVNATEKGGTLAIETGIFEQEATENTPLLYCPSKNSPYEFSSTSFFNRCGLEETLENMGCKIEEWFRHKDEKPTTIRRAFIRCTKIGDIPSPVKEYWQGIHNLHSGK